jgi:predicted amidohydrolase YtcJ
MPPSNQICPTRSTGHAPSPLAGIRDTVLRRTGSGRVLGPGERLPARDAHALYTTEAAFAVHREQEIGTLEPGKLADFVVLDRNPMDVEPAYQSATIVPEA